MFFKSFLTLEKALNQPKKVLTPESSSPLIVRYNRPRAEDRIPPGLKNIDSNFLRRTQEHRAKEQNYSTTPFEEKQAPTLPMLEESHSIAEEIMQEEKRVNFVTYMRLRLKRLKITATKKQIETHQENMKISEFKLKIIEEHSPVNLSGGLYEFIDKNSIFF